MKLKISILLLILSISFCKETANKPLKLITMSMDNGAKCQDGSPTTIHYREGFGENKDKFVFVFQGGGWCSGYNNEETLDNCVFRVQNYVMPQIELHVGSSKFQKEELFMEGFYSGDPKNNPKFYNYNMIIVNYCDGSGHQGYLEDPIVHNGQELWFRGEANTLEAFNYAMNTLGMKNASKVIVNGCSAGGLACFYWVDELRKKIQSVNQNTEVFGHCDSGVFLDKTHLQTNKEYNLWMKNIFNISNKTTPHINKKCAEAYPNEQWKCMLGEYLLEFIETKTLIVQSQYDTADLEHMTGVSGECVNMFTNKFSEQCTQKELQAVEKTRNQYLNKVLESINKNPNLGLWSPTCLTHCFLYNEFANKDWAIPPNSEQTLSQTVYELVEEGKVGVHYDKEPYPSNRPCSRLTEEEFKARYQKEEL